MLHRNSTKSYEEYKPVKQDIFRKRVWMVYNEAPKPLTDREVMEILKEGDVNNVRPEITRLTQDGLLMECGQKRCEFTGKTVRLSCVRLGRDYFDKGKSR